MARKQDRAEPGVAGPPDDGGLSIDRLAQAFAAMMGTADPWQEPEQPAPVVEVDTSLDLDAVGADDCPVTPATILEALLFAGLPGGRPLSSRAVAALMRGVRPQEIDDWARELGRRYAADNCPYEVASREDGWVLRLRPEFVRFGAVLEQRARTVRLDAHALDVLAVVAWNQPVPRDRLVELGCDAPPATLRALVRRGLLAIEKGAADPGGDAAGTPAYVTTPRFLEVFGLASLAELPAPGEPPA